MLKLTHKDIVSSLAIGELVSWFALFVLKNPAIAEFSKVAGLTWLNWVLPIGLPLLFLVGMFVVAWLNRFVGFLFQLAKYAQIGVLNTLVDFGILNLLIWTTNTTSGWKLGVFNIISFSVAVVNSYFWNKFWTFESKAGAQGKEFVSFVTVSFIGVLINTAIVYLGAGLANSIPDVSAGGWINLVKILATVVSLVWNFLGYKFFVFKKPNLPMKV